MRFSDHDTDERVLADIRELLYILVKLASREYADHPEVWAFERDRMEKE